MFDVIDFCLGVLVAYKLVQTRRRKLTLVDAPPPAAV
jgi:hypothetical protein